MPAKANTEQPISAEPTKGFFVDMITRDIPLDQTVLDLVDNSIDAANRYRKKTNSLPLDGFKINIKLSGSRFEIVDNCRGFSKQAARDYAFRFGRPGEREQAEHSIGQFGIGMKRALFKIGDRFKVVSATGTDTWAIDVDVPAWREHDSWTFPWQSFPEDSQLSNKLPGTEIVVENLRPEVASRFGTRQFINGLEELIASKHRQFISEGLAISLNAKHLAATSLDLLFTDLLQPGVDILNYSASGKAPVRARVVVGLGESKPRSAGWYVVCNGRVVLEADRSVDTGWGLIEEGEREPTIPKYHGQYARFRGIVYFDSSDSARVPWNTMKTDIDPESVIWQKTYVRMVEMMRPVIDFLNRLDDDIDENTRDGSALFGHVAKASHVSGDTLAEKRVFQAPKASQVATKGPRMRKVQYSRPQSDIEFLQDALDVDSGKAVGELTFDMALRKHRGK
jgi:hypothetical protein